MTAKSTAQFFIGLGITQSHSRPSVSDDNPFSEAAFKTFLYRPGIPERFGSLEDARAFFEALMRWYNEEHCHSGIALLTPGDVHRGTAPAIIAKRQAVLDAAHRAHPERFVSGTPAHPTPPPVVWITPPTTALSTTEPTQAGAPVQPSATQGGPQRAAAAGPEPVAELPRARTASRGQGSARRPQMPARAKPRRRSTSEAVLH